MALFLLFALLLSNSREFLPQIYERSIDRLHSQHCQSLFYLAPRALRKVFLLSELAGDSDPLSDVMGRSLPEVAAACDQATQWLAAGWDQILARLALVETMSKGTGSA